MNEKKTEIICSVQSALDIIGGKWVLPIVNALLHGKHRFKELERSIPNINTRMLVKELKVLEKYGLVTRKVFPTVPPTVEYELTERGQRLRPILTAINEWSIESMEFICKGS